MSEKNQKDQRVGGGDGPKTQTEAQPEAQAAADPAARAAAAPAGQRPHKPAAPTREDRLAEALRANLRRRKSAARTRKDG